MEISKLLQKLQNYKAGTFIKIEWEKEVSSAKAKKSNIQVLKHSEGIFRVDVDYKNLSVVQDKAKTTDNDNSSSKESWFIHSALHDAIVENKKDSTKKYLQVFLGANNKVKTSFKISGEEQQPQKLYEDGLITKAALPNNDNNDMITFVLGIENILAFGK